MELILWPVIRGGRSGEVVDIRGLFIVHSYNFVFFSEPFRESLPMIMYFPLPSIS